MSAISCRERVSRRQRVGRSIGTFAMSLCAVASHGVADGWLGGVCYAQNPFGDIDEFDVPSSSSFGDSGSVDSGSQGGLDIGPVNAYEPNAVVRSLHAHPPRTVREQARAIQLMARIQRWDEVKRWLELVEKQGIDGARASAMVDQVGAEVFQRLASPLAELEPKHRELSGRIVELSNAYRLAPETISTNVRRLQASETGQWGDAFRTVRSTGYPGIVLFFEGVMREGAPEPNRGMSEALRKLGQPAKDAWTAAMRSPHADVRDRLLKMARGAQSPLYANQLQAYLTDDETDIDAALSTFEAAKVKLRGWLEAYRTQRFLEEESTGVRWRLGADGRSVEMVECRPSELLWERITVEATNMLYASNRTGQDSAVAAAVLLQESPNFSPGYGFRDELGTGDELGIDQGTVNAQEAGLEAAVPSNWRQSLDRYEFACMVWDAALEYDLPIAQYAAVSKLAQFTENMPNEVRARLVNALDSGHRVVRYSAASALARSIREGVGEGAAGSFYGRGRLDRVIAEMTQLAPKRRAVVVGGSGSLRTHMRSLLESFGYGCEEFSNGRTLVARCKEGAPIDEIFIVSRVYEMDLGDLIQRLRGTPSASRVPIGLLAESLSSRELAFVAEDPRVKLGSVPPTADDLEPTLIGMRWIGQTAPIGDEAKLMWKQEADQFIAWQKPPAVVPTRGALVASIPQSPAGQRELVLKALDSLLPMPDREHASQIFVQSVQQFGLLISSETADGLYDVYNERASREHDLRTLLGRILDAVEADRGERDWESVRP